MTVATHRFLKPEGLAQALAADRVSTRDAADPVAYLSDQLGAIQTDRLSWGWPDTQIGGSPSGGLAPTVESGNVSVSGVRAGANSWRSERVVCTGSSSPHTPVKGVLGDMLTVEVDIKVGSGFASQPADNHNVLMQIHGPLRDGNWPPPPVELNFQNGSYRVSTSATSPHPVTGELVPTFDEYHPRIWLPSAQRTNAWHRWKFAITLGAPGSGRVDVWCDGAKVVHDWRPRPGTFYTPFPSTTGESTRAHEYVYVKYGCYGGGTAMPADRYVYHRGLRCTLRDLNNVRTWRMPEPDVAAAPGAGGTYGA